MRMLDRSDEVEVSVTREDQMHINTFSKLTAQLDDLDAVYDSKKREKEYLDDLVQELELAEDGDVVRYRIGESFMALSLAEALARIGAENACMLAELEDVQTRMSEIQATLAKLKAVLYAKFGKAINLDK
ncbi:hypothetical protein SeMB42_g03846 [Synchytrium endobioticum]|uniref:Prefoldin subunit 4 n=1 Tax=Synchytrium endobioticum TaxID=286115 RepID=A0A507CM04_9FUNG|nr:hypothetical protein SeLEV6574_g06970 [Synchytrium endobioticum]TPX45951.1 hypothetical protein SeMB42_g03846 [Synchytrium endobioticum]